MSRTIQDYEILIETELQKPSESQNKMQGKYKNI